MSKQAKADVIDASHLALPKNVFVLYKAYNAHTFAKKEHNNPKIEQKKMLLSDTVAVMLQ